MTVQSSSKQNHPQIWIQEVKNVDYLIIGATIRIGQESWCLPYAGFFLVRLIFLFFLFLKRVLQPGIKTLVLIGQDRSAVSFSSHATQRLGMMKAPSLSLLSPSAQSSSSVA